MALSHSIIVSLLLVCLVLCLVDANQQLDHQKATSKLGFGRSLQATIDCSTACRGRCKLSSRPNLCNRACGTCCARCNCVPSGTSGNTEQCPCYANMTTHGDRKKCP